MRLPIQIKLKTLNLSTFPEKWCQPRRQIQWKGTELEGLLKHS